jgi:hypothetical protein
MEEIIAATFEWNERKRMFSEDQLRLAAEVLTEKGWLPPDALPVTGS